MSRDLRKDFDSILYKWGHDVYLWRVENVLQPGEKPRYHTSNGRPILERHTTRHTYPGSRALGNIASEEIEGVLHDHEFIYYFRHNVVPRPGDLIVEFLDRYPNNQLYYKVDLAIPLRGWKGQIVYWATGVTKEDTPERSYVESATPTPAPTPTPTPTPSGFIDGGDPDSF